MNKRGQWAVYFILLVVLVILVGLTFTRLNWVQENAIDQSDALSTDYILTSCGEAVLKDGIRAISIQAGHYDVVSPVVVTSVNDLGDFAVSLEQFVEREYWGCVEKIQTIEHYEDVSAAVEISSERVELLLSLDGERSGKLFSSRVENVQSIVAIPLGNLLSSVEQLVASIEEDYRIPQTVILDLMIAYDVDIFTEVSGSSVSYVLSLPQHDVYYTFVQEGGA